MKKLLLTCMFILIAQSFLLFGAYPALHGSNDEGESILQIEFEDPLDMNIICVVGAPLNTELSRDESISHSGQASLKLMVTDPGGTEQLRPAIDIELSRAVPSYDIKAISCWVHVSPRLAGYFFGRYDARILVNGSKPLWSLPAIEPGWTQLRWEFSNLYQHLAVNSIRLQFGPILPGFSKGSIHVDGFIVEGMESIGGIELEQLIEITGDPDRSWSQRFQAIRRLESESGLEALPSLFKAVADGAPEEGFNPESVDIQSAYIDEPPEGSEAVRSAAKKAIRQIAKHSLVEELPHLRTNLERALGHADGRIRLAAVEVLPVLETNQWVLSRLEQALLDDLYYIREFAIEVLETMGHPPSDAAKVLAQILLEGTSAKKIAAARCLSEIGSPAISAMPAIINVLRDTKADQQLRLWCLRAAWWTDESVLRPEDWVLGLALEPGEVHRHLLNRAMDRLQKAGQEAIPALEGVLSSHNPEERARAATLLRKTGDAGMLILETVQEDPVWYVRAAAGYDSPLGEDRHEPVRVEKTGNLVSFSNGLIEIEFDMDGQDPGPASARMPGGENMIDSEWLYKLLSFKDSKAQSIIERVWFQKIHGVALNKALQWEMGESFDKQAEIICRYPGGGGFPLEWEFHYVLRRGDSGFYTYIIVRNVTGSELPESISTSGKNSIGMFNQLVAPTWGLFKTAVLHDNFKWPASFNQGNNFSLYPDIYQATYRMPDGEVDAKHEGSNHELNSPVTGYMGPHGGFWQIIPSFEFSGGAWPWDQKTNLAHNMFVTALENKYYIPIGVKITDGWEKLYGPIFYYLNKGDNTEEMWADAKRQAALEVDAWPYTWLDYKGYHNRGSVNGHLRISGEKSPSGAWALLALPDDNIPESIEFGEWWRDVGPYHYCAPVQEDGSFEIPNVRSGDYDLFIWHEGIYGEFSRKGLSVKEGEVLDAGECLLFPRDEGHLLWQIGDPNRTMTEFRNGGNYHQWETYLRYRDDFPEGMNFKIGRSDPKKDWNYLQPAIIQGESEPTSAVVTFDFDSSIPGDPFLTIVAGGRGVDMEILINGEKIGNLNILNIGLQHIRTAPHGELTVHRYKFDRSLLRNEGNQVTLRFARESGLTEEARQWSYKKWTSYIAYDFIRMELVP